VYSWQKKELFIIKKIPVSAGKYMKTAYFGISKSNRINFNNEIIQLKKCLSKNSFELLVFVDKYNFKPNQEKEMMRIAFEEIDNANFLIVELSKKAIGVGVEVGYAVAIGKPIIYLKRKNADYSTTVAGCSDIIIEYENEFHLIEELEKLITKDASLFQISIGTE
jgi:nucleoside 2-deoxyribosyltransferase